jgi:hypothetical protein
MTSSIPPYDKSVFINCPFDPQYKPILYAIVFTVYDCGYIPRSALETVNEPVRLQRILDIIRQSKYSINDLSRAGCGRNRLARFNMPLELGLFIGAKKFGDSRQSGKTYLILDRDRFRYQQFISDLAGNDPKPHNGDYRAVIRQVRNWLNDLADPDIVLYGGEKIVRRYEEFRKKLPLIAGKLNLSPKDLTYKDYCVLVQEWFA